MASPRGGGCVAHLERDERRIVERLQFIERHAAGKRLLPSCAGGLVSVARRGYKLIGRYEAYGEGGLLDLQQSPSLPPQRHTHTSG